MDLTQNDDPRVEDLVQQILTKKDHYTHRIKDDGMENSITHQRLRLFLFLIFIIFLNVAPIILQRRDKEKNNFYFHRKCVFLG